MASAKQQTPGNETCSQEQHGFWGSKMFGGQKQNTDNQQAAKETQQNNGWWFGGQKQAATTTQHCSTCQCSAHDKNPKPITCEGVNKKDHTIGITVKEEQVTIKNSKATLKQTEMKTEEKMSGKKVEHGGNLIHGKKNACTESQCKINTSGGAGKTKEQRENHCFRSMADHMKQRIILRKNNHAEKYSDSSSDSDDEKIEKKKKDKGQPHGTKLSAK